MNTTFQKIIIPVAIVLAGALIAAAIYFTQSKPIHAPVAGGQNAAPADVKIAPITSADHIRGKLDAKVTIVDYSDLECPFCKQFHSTLKQIFDQYGPTNQVAWVYRHFPLDIHPKSRKESEASECAQELGGSDVFWKYVDAVYATTTSNNTLDPAKLPVIADQIGLDKTAFTTCLNSGKYAAKVDAQYNDARNAGGNGTPYTILVINGQNIPLVDNAGNGLGALPYAQFKSIIDQFVK